jgi:hypothetical protein
VMFRSIYPWTPVPVDAPHTPPILDRVLPWVVWVLFLGLLVLAAVTARRNLREGRADTRGALRMAIGSAVLYMLAIWASVHYVDDSSVFGGLVFNSIARSALLFLVVSALYLTLEPVVRRTWPSVLVSWVRLLDARFRDSLLGRDVLAGLSLGLLTQVLALLGAQAWAAATGGHALAEYSDAPGIQTTALMSTGLAVTVAVRALLGALQTSLAGAALTALFTQITHRRVPALVLGGFVMLIIQLPGMRTGFAFVLVPLIIAVGLASMVRFGFVAMLAYLTTWSLVSSLPIVTPGSSWYWPTTAVGVVLMLGAALWSLRSMLTVPAASAAQDDWRLSSLRGASAGSRAYASGAAARTPAPAASTSSQLPTELAPRATTSSQTPTEFAPRPEGGPGDGGPSRD